MTVVEVDGERAVVLPWRTTFLWQPFGVSVLVVVVGVVLTVVLHGDSNPG